MTKLTSMPIAALLFLLCSFNPLTGANSNEPENYAMPAEYLKENLMATDYTAVVVITSSKIVEDGTPGYINHVYTADVKETIKGPKYKTIMYSVGAEEGIEPIIPKYPVVVSLCGSNKKSLYTPDNGYVSATTPDLLKFARSFKNETKSTDTKSVCSK